MMTRLKHVLSKFRTDFSGTLFMVLDTRLLIIQRIIFSFWVTRKMKTRGIKYASPLFFYGNMIFRRHFKSTISIGKNCRFRSSFTSNAVGLNRKCFISTFQENARLEIGENSGFSGTVIGCAESITIGRNVICGGNTFITDSDWHPLDRSDSGAAALSTPVVIEDDVWLGLNVVILKGVTIGKGSVIGANSVVAKSIPVGVIAAGNPCRILGMIEKHESID